MSNERCVKCGTSRPSPDCGGWCRKCFYADLAEDFAEPNTKPRDLCNCCQRRPKFGGGCGPYCKTCYHRIRTGSNAHFGGEPGIGLCSQCGFRPKLHAWNVCKECIKAINEAYWQQAQDDIEIDPKTKEIEREPLHPMERCELPSPTGPHIEYIEELPPVMLCPACYQPMDFWDADGTVAFHCMGCQRSVVASQDSANRAIATLALETAAIVDEADHRRYAIHGEEE